MDQNCKKLISAPIPPFRLLWASDAHIEPRFPFFQRYNYQICTVEYVLSGVGYLEVNGSPKLRVESDSVYFLPKHSNHLYYHDSENPWVKLFIEVDGALMESLMKAYGLDQVPVIPHAQSLRRYFEEFIAIFRHARHDQAALLFHEFAMAANALLESPDRRNLTPVSRLKQLLEQNLDKEVFLEDYVKTLSMTPEHLIRLFKKEYQETPMAYRMAMRLNAAARLLSFSDLSIKEIAAAVGFADANYFSNCFKHHRGMTPKAFRAEKSGGNSSLDKKD